MISLEKFNGLDFNFYSAPSIKLMESYSFMYSAIESSGQGVTPDWTLDSGILVEDGEDVVAGIFFNTKKYPSAILIHLAYVSPEYRKRGIYRKLHELINTVGKGINKTKVFSYIHLDNKEMVDIICDKIGYKPIMQVVSRNIT